MRSTVFAVAFTSLAACVSAIHPRQDDQTTATLAAASSTSGGLFADASELASKISNAIPSTLPDEIHETIDINIDGKIFPPTIKTAKVTM